MRFFEHKQQRPFTATFWQISRPKQSVIKYAQHGSDEVV
jgi:hypothetical protein